MAVEIEAKLKVDSLKLIVDKLIYLDAKEKGKVLELNIFFDREDHALQAADKGLRIRTNRDTTTGNVETIVTFKGPRQHGPLKSREERELKIESAEDGTRLFEALGYAMTLTFEKRRNSWTLDNCKVELDELPLLGTFIEVEGPTEQAVLAVLDKLQMRHLPPVKASYAAMLTTHLQDQGTQQRVVKF